MNNLIANSFSNLSKFNKKIIIIFVDLFFFLFSHLLSNYLRNEKLYFTYDFYPFLILFKSLKLRYSFKTSGEI